MDALTTDALTEQINSLLRRLGANDQTRSFSYTAYGVLLAMQCPACLDLITKRLYPEIGKEFGTNWKAAEHNIRHLIQAVWRRNPSLLSELAGRPLSRRPTTREFLRILCRALDRNAAGCP